MKSMIRSLLPCALLRFAALARADEAGACSPILHVTPDDPPTLLVHGDEDKLVPLDHSEKIRAEFDEHHVACELLVLEGAAHGFRGEHADRATGALVAWFEKHLAAR